MAEIPRDPRQLARDILSGKIKLEDLQRERQRQGARPPPPSTPPPPRQAPTAPPPVMREQRPVKEVPIGPGTRMPEQVRTQPQSGRPLPTTVRGGQFPGKGRSFPGKAPPPPPAPPKRVETPIAPVQAEYEQAHDVPAKAAKPARRAVKMKDLMKSRLAIRQGILLSEILGKPVALREE